MKNPLLGLIIVVLIFLLIQVVFFFGVMERTPSAAAIVQEVIVEAIPHSAVAFAKVRQTDPQGAVIEICYFRAQPEKLSEEANLKTGIITASGTGNAKNVADAAGLVFKEVTDSDNQTILIGFNGTKIVWIEVEGTRIKL